MVLREALTEDEASEKFFAAFRNWYESSYGCRTCSSHLYKIVFPEGRELQIITDDAANPRVAIKRSFTCARCKRFVTSGSAEDEIGVGGGGYLGEPNNFEHQCGSTAEYERLLHAIDATGTSVGRQDAGFIRLYSPTREDLLMAVHQRATEALAAAAAIGDPDSRAWRIAGVVKLMASAGDVPAARGAAADIRDPEKQAHALTRVAEALAALGDAPAAREAASAARAAADGIPAPHKRVDLLAKVAEVLMAAGATAEALEAAAAATSTGLVPSPQIRFVEVLVASGAAPMAVAIANREEGLPVSGIFAARYERNRSSERVRVLVRIAKALAAEGDQPAAHEVAAEALAVAYASDSDHRAVDGGPSPLHNHISLLTQAAGAMVAAGDLPAAHEAATAAYAAANAFDSTVLDPRVLHQAIEALAIAGDTNAALSAASQVDDLWRAELLIRIALARTAAEDTAGARSAARAAARAAATAGLVYQRPRFLAESAKILAEAGDLPAAREAATAALDTAHHLLDTRPNKRDVAQAFIEVVAGLVAVGDLPSAREAAYVARSLAYSDLGPDDRAVVLIHVAQGLAAAGRGPAACQAIGDALASIPETGALDTRTERLQQVLDTLNRDPAGFTSQPLRRAEGANPFGPRHAHP